MKLAKNAKDPWIPKVVAVSYTTGQTIMNEIKNKNGTTITIELCYVCKPIEAGFKSIE